MKVLVVLTLAIFSVCNADVQSQEAPKIDLERVNGAFLDFFSEAVHNTEDLVKSVLGPDIIARIEQSTNAVLQDVAEFISQEFPAKPFWQGLEPLIELCDSLRPFAEDLKAKHLKPFAEDLKAKLLKQLEALIRETQSLHQQLTQKTQEIRESLIPYGDGMKAKLSDGFHFPGYTVSKASTHHLFLPSLLIVYLIK